ncbi:MAG TPA: pilus assembly protein PilM [Candidatus Paceibacterota bacterium]
MSIAQKLFKYFPAPRIISMPQVGVEITATSIRYMELARSGDGTKLGRYGTQEVPGGVSLRESLVANKDLVAALKKIQRANRFQFAEVSIPEEDSYLFTTEIPLGEDEEIRSHIEFHLEENVPVSLADAVFDYHVIHKDEKKGTGFASVSVVQRSVIDQYIDLFEMCGMTPISFIIENQALAKALTPRNADFSSLIVHVGAVKTVLSVVSEGAVQFTSTVSIGSNDFTAAIAKEYGISPVEAERLKQEKGYLKNPENNEFFMLLINAVSALRDEVQRVYMYWQTHSEKNGKQGSQTKVILAGRDSSIIGFREYLALSLKVPVELANVWANVFTFDKEIPPIEYLESLDYAVAVGLALPKNTD